MARCRPVPSDTTSVLGAVGPGLATRSRLLFTFTVSLSTFEATVKDTTRHYRRAANTALLPMLSLPMGWKQGSNKWTRGMATQELPKQQAIAQAECHRGSSESGQARPGQEETGSKDPRQDDGWGEGTSA